MRCSHWRHSSKFKKAHLKLLINVVTKITMAYRTSNLLPKVFLYLRYSKYNVKVFLIYRFICLIQGYRIRDIFIGLYAKLHDIIGFYAESGFRNNYTFTSKFFRALVAVTNWSSCSWTASEGNESGSWEQIKSNTNLCAVELLNFF